MIKLYREETSPQADAIEAEFRELVPGYDRLMIGKDEATRLFGAETPLPVITITKGSSAAAAPLPTSRS